MNKRLKNYAIILASGSGSRFGASLPKQFVEIAGRTILERTIDIFEMNEYMDSIILVVTPEYKDIVLKLLAKNSYKKIEKVLDGGKTRKESSSIGVKAVDESEANLFIHDCARPFLAQSVLNKCVLAMENNLAVDVAIPSTDTILEVKDGFIQKIPERKFLMRSQTPQCFRLSIIKKAHEISVNDIDFTDDCGLVLKYNLASIYVVEGNVENIKITYPTDEYLVEKFLSNQKSN